MKIPVNRPLLDGNEGRYLQECIDTGWISSEGPFVERFETEFSAKVGRKHGIAVSSGIYLFNVDAPGIGQRTIKWFGAVRPADTSNF